MIQLIFGNNENSHNKLLTNRHTYSKKLTSFRNKNNHSCHGLLHLFVYTNVHLIKSQKPVFLLNF